MAPPTTETHGPSCAMQRGMTLALDEHGWRRVAARGVPTNRGSLCRKGWAYMLGKFAGVALQTKHIDYYGRFGMASAAASLAHGDGARLTTRRGSLVVRARHTRDIRLDTVFVPFHWGGTGCANILTNPALDPVSRIPEFKMCAVRIERGTDPAEPSATTAVAAALHWTIKEDHAWSRSRSS